MSTFLCKNGVRKEYFLTPTFIIEPFFGGLCGLQSADDVLIFMMKKAEEKILQTPCYFFLFYCLSFPFVLQ